MEIVSLAAFLKHEPLGHAADVVDVVQDRRGLKRDHA